MKRNHTFSLKKLLFTGSVLLFLVIGTVLAIVISMLSNKLLPQQMAERWSEEKDVAQISCFFSVDAGMTVDSIETFEHNLDNALVEASIYSTSLNEEARLWADAYSATGKITISTDSGNSITSDALGVGGDFFLFHPLQLLGGSYFSGHDVNQDYVVLDRNAAWKLFGSNDVAGMTVYIGNIPHIIAGVVEVESGKLAQAGGVNDTVVFVSYDSLNKYGVNHGINHYEIVMPSPVSSYAFSYVKDNIGASEAEMEVVENSERFSFFNRLKLIKGFASRSMNGKAIIYPYWENIARGYENILSLLTVIMLLVFAYPATVLIVIIVRLWKKKTWTLKSIFLICKDKAERKLEQRRMKKMKEEMDYEDLI
ncbi:MAG: ABC transporter permease [Lachnospiraceae bacterium]|nr:ABC transporter permease [Lachnospiraceae bacterium]